MVLVVNGWNPFMSNEPLFPEMKDIDDLDSELSRFIYDGSDSEESRTTERTVVTISEQVIPHFVNQFWTSRQRKGNSLHEVSYRACFKPQLPGFFIERLSPKTGTVYDPFAGRGTTPVESALRGRIPISNDINPLSGILTLPRFDPPDLITLKRRMDRINLDEDLSAEMDLSMFYERRTEGEIVSLREYLRSRKGDGEEDSLDRWIRMVATNRLTGHSTGFFSVYTLPPNQAVTPERQVIINKKRDQKPKYRNTKDLILKKSRSLARDVGRTEMEALSRVRDRARVLVRDASDTPEIDDGSVDLTVTSPPFLNVVQYSTDNWLRCWFNDLDAGSIEENMTLPSSIKQWEIYMSSVFLELFRITRKGGWIAFEVGEVKGGSIRLEESVVPMGIEAGFKCGGVLINSHSFTKTSNIWGISNNSKGTNTNRVVLFRKA
jgi:hypothetical protein